MKTEDLVMNTARRRWLLRGGATLAGALGAGTLGNLLLNATPAYAADYKALVCIFLYGGNDGMNMIVPSDDARYNQYAGVRTGLAIPKASLTPLGGVSYVARGTVTTARDVEKTRRYLRRALETQIAGEGFSFVEILTMCPTGWFIPVTEGPGYLNETIAPVFRTGEFKVEGVVQ